MAGIAAIFSAVIADTPSQRAAVVFVEQAKIQQNLPVIVFGGEKKAVDVKIIVSGLGNARTVKALPDEIKALLPQCQSKWNENIA
ncbi:hypothetical protein DK871_04535 [Pseudomonas sp. L13]|nr:hypothetical protein [Pseudomonas sp. L13]